MQRIRGGWSHSTRSDCAYRPANSINYFESEHEAKKLFGIKPWIIRNLLTVKNCLMKRTYFMENKRIFERLFGAKQMRLTLSDKGCCILWITDEAVTKAKLLIY